MASLLSNDYLMLLKQTHSSNPDWGTSGNIHAKQVIDLYKQYKYESILDFGCGKGSLINTLTEYFFVSDNKPIIAGYDPAVLEFCNNQYLSGDLVTCTDVLEHIEPDYLDDVLNTIWLRTNIHAYFAISLQPARMILPDGRNAHLLVNNKEWWIEELERYYKRVQVLESPSFNEARLLCIK